MTSSTLTPVQVAEHPGRPPLLHVTRPADPVAWAAEHRDALRATIVAHGALLVRGLGLRDVAETAALFQALGTLMTEREGFAERRVHAPGVYSASRWPPNQGMCVHNELSYRLECPGLMLFACHTPATRGGATPLADAAAVAESLPAPLVERFERVGWLLVRNYSDEVGASLADAFGDADRGAIERYCHANAITHEWRPDGGLRTWQRRNAVVRHPLTGRRTWFNQVAFLSEWAMNPEVREYLVDERGEDGLPFATRFGDGAPITPDVVELINATYDAHTVRMPWEAGDLLLVDNIRTAHGREPFEGPRDLLVGLADPVRVHDPLPATRPVAEP